MRWVVCLMIISGISCAALIVFQAGSQKMNADGTREAGRFRWPEGKRAAVSLSFDDARLSQVDIGLELLRKHGVKATFFVQPRGVEQRLEGWKRAVADGQEIGNHTLTHPCGGDLAFSVHNALEDYNLRMMADQLDGANSQIQRLLGVKPMTFAYPCGQMFVGRGLDVRSYVPLVAERFLVGRGYRDEAANDPRVCDLARAMGTAFDDMEFAQMKKEVETAAEQGRWVIFAGHEIGKRGFQVTDSGALEALCDYCKDSANRIWIGTVAEIGAYVRKQREGAAK